ncbi:sugar-binding transcriptional regulator [Salibacterium halotolerans]|uniref:DNA-binding transcriptional regulator LsrR, DeoR family n=1 Tax=Salibacterium halotolerans TaxID=1884432 RepID=A0A1I5TEF0_9BACI|nr:sugar-binding transcriptional regulator [Salibacterium halotolerans]SFP81409.1 DNA-binding transcriptional regulator LsrR, DeoR family [Salibacterium halotolerans]
MLSWEERRQMVKAANLYYFDGWTQARIAKKMNVSRPVISKLLHKAKEDGIVEVYIKDESAQTVDLEQKLEKQYGLEEAIVLSTSGFTPEMTKRFLGKVGASYLSRQLDDNKKLGLSWGTTLASLVDEYPYERRDNVQIVPLVGGMGRSHVNIHSNSLAFNLAKKMNAVCSYLYAPAIVESEDLRDRLIQSKDVAHVLEQGKNVDVAVVGMGDPFKNSTMEEIGYLQAEDLYSLRKSGVVGDISSKFFDAVGQEVDHPLNHRVIGLGLQDLKKIPKVIGIVESLYKLESIEAALKGGYLDVLIIDDRTAEELVEE